MGILKSKEPDPVLEAIQKLRREVREMGDGWRSQQSVSNDKQEAILKNIDEKVSKLLTAWEKMSRA